MSPGPLVPLDDGGARHLAPGIRLPQIALPSTTGGAVDIAGVPGTTVLFIYPWSGRPGLPNPPGWDDIPGAHGSTPEAEGFRNLWPAYREIGVALYGVSGQDTDWQSEFSARLALPFPLLSDAMGHLAEALRLPTFSTGDVTYLKRLTLVIGNGRIERVFYPAHPPETHPRELLLWLEDRLARR